MKLYFIIKKGTSMVFKNLSGIACILALLLLNQNAIAGTYTLKGQDIADVKEVPDPKGAGSDKLIEIWLSAKPKWPAGSPCATSAVPRLYINPKTIALLQSRALRGLPLQKST